MALAKTTKATCAQSSVAWAAQRAQETADAAQNGESSSVWEQAKRLKQYKKKPSVAPAPLINAEMKVATSTK